MQQDKPMNAAERKRKMLLVLPLLFLPFVILLFYSLGGGQSKQTPLTDKKGINTTLPAAQLDDSKPSDKLTMYKQADEKASAMTTRPALDPFARQLFAAEPLDTPATPPPTYGLHPGGPSENFARRSQGTLADNEARITARINTLQQAINAASDSATSRVSPHPMPIPSLSAVPESGTATAATPSSDTQQDPELNQLNDMLEKVLDVQHPERVQARLKATSVKEPQKVFPVARASTQTLDDWTGSRHPIADSPRNTVAVKRLVAQANRFFELDDDTTANDTPNTIEAIVDQTQQVVSGQALKFRLATTIMIQGHEIPQGTAIWGIGELSGDRLKVHIDKITYRSSVYPVALSVYAYDGIEGIPILGAMSREVSKQGADQALQGMQLATMSQSLGAQAAASGVETVKTLLQKKMRLIKVTVKADQGVLLYAER